MASVAAAAASSTQTSSSIDRSGLSVDDVVTAKLQPLLDRIDTINQTISGNQAKVSAYQDMQQLLVNLQNAVNALSDPLDSDSDAFKSLAASLSSSSGTDASQIMSADIGTGAVAGTHQVTVTQLASTERLGSTSQSSRSSALNMSGTFSIGESGKTAASISVTAGMSLNDIASAINNQTSTTGVTASIITVSSSGSNPQYMLVLSGNDTNQTIQMSTSAGNVLSSLGVTEADGSTAASVLQEAKPAIMTVDGVTGIQRDTNDVSDVIDGVTLHLTQADPNTTISVDVSNDTSAIEKAVQNLADAYNAWRSFVAQNQATQQDGTAATSATLFGDSTLRSISAAIDSALTSSVGGTALGAIGISLDENNNLQVDDDKLSAALKDNFDQVKQLFAFTATTSSGNLTMSNHGSSTFQGSLTLNVTTDSTGNVTGATGTDANGNTVNFNVSGSVISAPSGSIYDGLQFVFTGSSSESITVTTSQGIADQLVQITDAADDTTSGTVQNILDGLNSQDTTLQARAADLQQQANDYQTFLLDQYGQLEASISQANQMQSILQQMMDEDTAKN